ncbi:fructokinase [Sphingomonas sp. Leaf407]|uniref:ROK family protein n=1 Tax=unclassified Sphingomonas TaxID=196159 RepID=UPI0006F4F55A|nr:MULTISPECIES: ROK family protein [unclassified Sphingomonas]KQN39590.1 fructokinase [Sphingomonas sp. Leaf42]KQT28867.1 fructokinase [Sphingomonas sp. Leaf407]
MDREPRSGGDVLPFAGVELGGTKCVCTLAYGPGAILAQETVPTTHPDETLPAIAAVLERWWSTHGFAALGIASFGPVDLNRASPTWGHILATTKPHWAMADVAGRLSAGLDVPVAFDTDVNGAAYAETRWGSGKGLTDFAYVTIGTGVGVGLLVNGAPTRGIGHAEIGHLRVPRLAHDTLPSGCPFHDDCVEGLASGTGIKAALGDVHVSTIPDDHPVWDRVVSAIVAMCHAMVATTGPQRIAIGGGVMNKQPHVLARIEPELRASINGYLPLPEGAPYIVAPALGDQAGPLGSIALAQVPLGERIAEPA